jgi:hypothetical protein
MSSNIVLNKSHITNKGNNKLTYRFPRDKRFEKNDQLAISHLNIYYSWFNISKKYNNNFFQYKWWNAAGELGEVIDVVIEDGFYSTQTLYEYIQRAFVANKHYLITDTGDYVYFIELLDNITYYSVEWRLSSLSAQYVTDYNLQYPASTVWKAPPNLYETPQIIIPSTNAFGELIGFERDRIIEQPSSSESGQYSFLNDFAPNMNPSSSFIVTCNLIDNDLGSPNNIIYSFTIPNKVEFGDLITSNTDVIYSKIKEGTYRELKLSIYDQDFNELTIIDPNLLIVISILN